MNKKKSNYARMLVLLRILVDETRRDAPLTMGDILTRCEDEGAPMTDNTFSKYLNCMAEADILISRKLPDGMDKGPFLYWYENGWV